MSSKFLFTGLFFVFILLSGFWLSRTGKPINTAILTIHKLISLGAGIFLGITIYRIHQVTPLSPFEMAAVALTLLFFIAMVATGGMLSTAKSMPGVFHKIHQLMPYLVIISAFASIYLVQVRKV
jgi:hypothetical protein